MQTITSDRPIPDSKKYPWDKMNIGDSFEAKGVNIRSIRTQASRAGRLYKARFRVQQQGSESDVIIWRVQ